MELFYLLPSEIYVGARPACVRTLLGSCVSVCLWCPMTNIGGINHYLLPSCEADDINFNKYGNTSILNLISRMKDIGANGPALQAKIFGGANVIGLNEKTAGFFDIGQKNIDAAFEILSQEGINVVNYDVGGKDARIIIFNTANFEIKLKRIIK
jgi:chemotaxis protein CheD